MGGGAFAPAATLAQPTTPLAWNAPAGCPSASDVQARVSRQLAERQLSDQSWQASARVRRHGSRFRLELSLEISGAVAQRAVDAESCETLADTTGLLIALALADAQRPEATPPPAAEPPAAATEPQPTAAESAAPNEPPKQATPPPKTEASEPDEAPAEEPSASTPGNPLPFGFGVGASLRLDVGTFPAEPTFGLAPRVLAKLGPLSATAGVTFWLPAQRGVEVYPSARLEGRGVLADLVLGFELTREPISFAPCLAIEHGQLRVRSLDVQTPDGAQYAWTAAGGGVRAGVGLGAGLYTGLELLGLAPWSRQGFYLRTPAGDLPVFRAAPLVLRISAELAYVFE